MREFQEVPFHQTSDSLNNQPTLNPPPTNYPTNKCFLGAWGKDELVTLMGW